MCLVNVAVTALKRHNLILTTSLRRHRSDKHAELRRDEATASLSWWGPCPADTQPDPALPHPPDVRVSQVSGSESTTLPPGGMSHAFQLQTHLCRRRPPLPPSTPTCHPLKQLHPERADPRTPHLGGRFSPLQITRSPAHTREASSAHSCRRWIMAALAEQGQRWQPIAELLPRHPSALQPFTAAQGSPAPQPGAQREDASEESSLGPHGGLLWTRPSAHAAAGVPSSLRTSVPWPKSCQTATPGHRPKNNL